jgi:hypothetical protein
MAQNLPRHTCKNASFLVTMTDPIALIIDVIEIDITLTELLPQPH